MNFFDFALTTIEELRENGFTVTQEFGHHHLFVDGINVSAAPTQPSLFVPGSLHEWLCRDLLAAQDALFLRGRRLFLNGSRLEVLSRRNRGA